MNGTDASIRCNELYVMIKKLTIVLEATVRALECHIHEESHRNGVTSDELCPCHTSEIKAAQEVLAAVRRS